VPVDRPFAYDLPVMKIISTKQWQVNGRTVTVRSLYVYWFVADNAISGEPSGLQRMWWTARQLLRAANYSAGLTSVFFRL